MNLFGIEKIADALLYEGSWLYPYRPSAQKNRFRWTFGVLFPRCWCGTEHESEAWAMQSECLALAGPDSNVEACGRFLISSSETHPGQVVLASPLRDLLQGCKELPVRFPGIEGKLELSAQELHPQLFRIR